MIGGEVLSELALAALLAGSAATQWRQGRGLEARIETLRTENREDHRRTGQTVEMVRDELRELKAWQDGHDTVHRNERWMNNHD